MKMMSFFKKNMKSSSGSNNVLEVSLSKYGVDSKTVTYAEITDLCKV